MYPACLRMLFCSYEMKFKHWYAHQVNINKAPCLPSIVNSVGDLADNKLGRKVAAEGFKGPGLDPSNKRQDKE